MAADVDAVQELSDIFVLDQAGLANEGGRSGGEVDVGACDDQLILGLSTLLHLDALQHVDDAHSLLAEEIPQLASGAVVGDGGVDGKVSVHEAHAVLVLLHDAVEQVADVAANRAEHGKLLGFGEVHSGADLLSVVGQVQLDRKVLEVTLQGAELAGDLAILDLMVILTSLGTLMDSSWHKVRMVSKGGGGEFGSSELLGVLRV
eukprot:CAMPEP_0206451454 /NCGR_PEP_ID=MMETSP0324_2-20121206/19350_1 /ASSEMBLY_ACC=CAM_ASM_000836 /TAXON_ID=2866 /ORGANISM="Crypthecodinium cohnii, Strain Seligo" /LENGTH=203 /DNA_ID=CAMNT_0053921337 /DNA_START=192 /DNA_END=804 /DNA_ORIENTATION=-